MEAKVHLFSSMVTNTLHRNDKPREHLEQNIKKELCIFLLLCHSQVQKLQQPGRNIRNQKKCRNTSQLSGAPFLEAITIAKLQTPLGTANVQIQLLNAKVVPL